MTYYNKYVKYLSMPAEIPHTTRVYSYLYDNIYSRASLVLARQTYREFLLSVFNASLAGAHPCSAAFIKRFSASAYFLLSK